MKSLGSIGRSWWLFDGMSDGCLFSGMILTVWLSDTITNEHGALDCGIAFENGCKFSLWLDLHRISWSGCSFKISIACICARCCFVKAALLLSETVQPGSLASLHNVPFIDLVVPCAGAWRDSGDSGGTVVWHQCLREKHHGEKSQKHEWALWIVQLYVILVALWYVTVAPF